MGSNRFEFDLAQRRNRLPVGQVIDGDGKRIDLIGAEMSRDGECGDAQISAFRPDDGAKRSEFSLHIGC